MNFHGFQKMTLLDFPGRVAATLFTGGCNFRCPFCHNASLVTHVDDGFLYTEEEILSFLEKRRGLLDGVAVTGGEPLLHPEILPFLEKVRAMGYAVKLDTNGTRPELLKKLVSQGLVDYVAVDIKNAPELYARTCGLETMDLTPIRETVAFLLSGAVDYEFRTTVVEGLHTVDSIRAAAESIKGAKRYFLQNFVDSGDLIGEGMGAVSKETLLEMKKTASEYVSNTELRGV